ncbi:MAG: signal peptidase I [Lachnospiraceae bacterium]|nr:signal peptidase I [Lachnospiraceae bacterium]
MSAENEVKEAEGKQKSTAKKVLGIIGNIILWIFVAFSALITVLAFAQTSSSYNVPSIGKMTILNVQTPSMRPTFDAGDIIIGTKVEEAESTKFNVGDIITFAVDDLNGDGYRDLNTHRIVEVLKSEAGDVTGYRTRGDNNPIDDADTVNVGAVVCSYTGTRIPKIGKFLSFLQTPTGFLIVIVIPLVIFFIFELITFIRKVFQIKNAGKKQITAADEELIRQRAVEEYLRQQQAKAEEEAKQAQREE